MTQNFASKYPCIKTIFGAATYILPVGFHSFVKVSCTVPNTFVRSIMLSELWRTCNF